MPKVGSDNKAITVIISNSTYEVLKDWAISKDWSISQAARNLIESGLDKETSPDDRDKQTK